MWLSLRSAILLFVICTVLCQSKSDSSECLANKDCPSDRLCAESKCINPCLLNLCGDNSNCKVTNHIPVCACRGSFSGPLNGGSSNRNGKKKYQLFLQRMNWFGALGHCISQGMSLATIDNQEEQTKIVNLIKQSDKGDYKMESMHRRKWWIGGSDLQQRGEFMWTSIGQLMTYRNFANGQPDNAVFASGEMERCMELPDEDWNFKWNDYTCHHSQYFICEYYE